MSAYTLTYWRRHKFTQAFGRTVDGRPFCFHARRGYWSLYVGRVGFPDLLMDWPDEVEDEHLVAEGHDPTNGELPEAAVRGILDEHLP